MAGKLKPGRLFLDRYRIEHLIAEGGMASIYRAFDEQQNRPVAIKALYPYYSDNQVIRARFVEEGRIQQMLGHPNVVHVYELTDEPLAIVMEHVDGPTLDAFLQETGPLGERELLDVIIPVMSAVGFAHGKGIIHRDIKPSNILIQRRGDVLVPKVMDFGVAKVKGAGRNLTATGTTVGTLHYMSPEQIVGSKNIDGRADIYSLGVTIYKLVTGEVPFNAPTEFALMMAQVEAPPLPPGELRPDISQELEKLILKAMEKKPRERFQTIRNFTTALLNMNMREAHGSVRDTITDSISQEILEFAMAADEVARDRTGEMNLRVVPDEEIAREMARYDGGGEEEDLPETEEISATIRLDRNASDRLAGPLDDDATEKLRRSEIIRLTQMGREADETDREFYPDNASTLSGDRRDRDAEDSTTLPSGPSAKLDPPPEEVETESIQQRIKVDELRGGVVVMDDEVGSRDMTAPKVSSRDFRDALAKNPPPESRNSGPSVVLGLNPADTQERTAEKPNFRDRLAEVYPDKFDESPPDESSSAGESDEYHSRERKVLDSGSRAPSSQFPIGGRSEPLPEPIREPSSVAGPSKEREDQKATAQPGDFDPLEPRRGPGETRRLLYIGLAISGVLFFILLVLILSIVLG